MAWVSRGIAPFCFFVAYCDILGEKRIGDNMDNKTLYEEIAERRRALGFTPECGFCKNTGYRVDYHPRGTKQCTKCFSVDKSKEKWGIVVPDISIGE